MSEIKYSKMDPHDLDITKWSRFMPPTSGRSSEEFRRLKRDIKLHGQKVPVEVYRGGVVDGLQRVFVCRDLGIRCQVMFLPDDRFAADSDVEAYIINVQLGRRNLTDNGWSRSLARAQELEGERGVTAAEFARKKAAEHKVTPKQITRAVQKGRDLNRVPPKVVEKVMGTCDAPDKVLTVLSSLQPDDQCAIVEIATSEREILNEAIMRRNEVALSRAVEKSPPVPVASETHSPLTPENALRVEINGAFDHLSRLLRLYVKTRPNLGGVVDDALSHIQFAHNMFRQTE